MARNITIDYLRCIAFILMIIHHIYYIPKVFSKDRQIPDWVSVSGYISRHIFIILVGISLTISYKTDPKNFNKKQIMRAIKVLIHAFFITLISYQTLGKKKMIMCGVLHFIGITVFLFHWFAQQPALGSILILLISTLNTQISEKNYFTYVLGNPTYHIGGIDYFNLNSWLPLVLVGILIGQNIEKPNEGSNNICVDTINKYCLELYTLHISLLLVYYHT